MECHIRTESKIKEVLHQREHGVGGCRRGKGGIMVTQGDVTWGVNTQYNIRMMCYGIIHPKPT